ANIAGLGATPYLIGIVGNDAEADLTASALKNVGVSAEKLIRINGRRTTVKTRVVAHGQQIVRIDHETDGDLGEDDERSVIDTIRGVLDDIDVVVISDYAKGFLTRRILAGIVEAASSRNRPVLVDPKGKDYTKYSGATLLTPNQREAGDAAGLENKDNSIVSKA